MRAGPLDAAPAQTGGGGTTCGLGAVWAEAGSAPSSMTNNASGKAGRFMGGELEQ
jgi:hypothetical protein